MDHELNLDADGAALTAALTDIASVSGEEKPLADAIERALAPLPHLTTARFGNTLGNVPSSFNPERTRLTGCGTSDMKSGVAVQLRLAAGLTGSRPGAPSRDVTYVFYECEEVDVERNGLFKLSRSAPELLAGDFAVLLEPSGGAVEGGCQGTLRAAVTATGVRAHTARSWMGRNAIHETAAILEVLRSWEARRPVVDGLEYHEGLNAVAVSGGVAGNVVPDSCTVTVNYRFAPDRSGAEAEAYIRSVFSAWEVSLLDVAGGARPGLSFPAAAAFVAAVGGTPRAKLGWTDVARFAELGIPAVNYGPGIPELAHTPGEYVEVAAIAECESRLRAWLDG